MARVESGLAVFARGGPRSVGLAPGARVGLLSHPASIDAEGRHAVDLLVARDDLRVERLFAPEHGLRGEAQDMEAVAEQHDPATGIAIASLYGADAASLRPKPEDLSGIDAVVCDLQDVGARYYTFVYTIAYVMEAARDAGLPVVVLDRPNPLGGLAADGPVLRPGWESFVGRYPIAVRHGLTPAELAKLFNDAFGIGCDLRVVPMAGWRRALRYDATGLPWVAPSPNMPTLATALVYPGGCLVEGTNLSEARGTTRPFELAGAPWLDGAALAERLRREALPGCMFRATTFRPEFQKHAGRSCGGIQVHVTDAGAFRPFETYLAVLREARALDPASFDWRRSVYEFESDRLAIDLLLGRPDLRPMIEGGAAVAEMEAAWRHDLEAFRMLRRRYLIYPD